jgi:2-aminoethylphosphonate-pyruvate transaminase
METKLPTARDKLLFTPGPLTTSLPVKQAMLRDLGSRDTEFIRVIQEIRDGLLDVAGLSQAAGYEAIPLQGSGTYAIEAVVSSLVPPHGKLLVMVNGAYGRRIVQIAGVHRIPTVQVSCLENQTPDLAELERLLSCDAEITDVAVVHCETTSGIMNPIEAIGGLVHKHSKKYFVDSMSAFGAVEFDLRTCEIDYLVSSANKCIEGVPGFAFAICRRDLLERAEGWARTVSLDLLAQWRGLETNGQFRFTPPTHALLAFRQALEELRAEGGPGARSRRYQANHRRVVEGMRRMGFTEYVAPPLQSHIITSFRYPDDAAFDFQDFYDRLSRRGYLIYPGKVTEAECFRIGNIGRLFREDIDGLLAAIGETVVAMGIVQVSVT